MAALTLGTFLGAGGFGSVYRARLGTVLCAAKIFYTGYVEDGKKIQAEIELLRRLRHRNVIQFYQVDYHKGQLCLVMELAEQGSLSRAIQRRPLDWLTKFRIAHEIARGLEYIHQENVLHRNVTSSNVLLTRYMEVKLCDFGLASISSASISEADGNIVGTVRWMAPETFYRKPKYSTKSDVYGLGVVMWEMAANCIIPFKECNSNAELALMILEGVRETLPEDTPVVYRQWVERCWAQDPEKRPEAREVLLVEDEPWETDHSDRSDLVDVTESIPVSDVSVLSAASRELARIIPSVIIDTTGGNLLPSLSFSISCSEPDHDIARHASHKRLSSIPLIIRERIGSGMSGTVFHGRWHSRACAVKRFYFIQTGSHKEAIQNEIAIVQELRHRHLIQFYGNLYVDGHIHLVMELAENGNLASALKNGGMDWPTKYRFAHEIARGLEYLHQEGFLHRNLRSTNVLLTKNMEVKLCDFALAHAMALNASRSVGRDKGTIRWMAPELFTRRPQYSAKSDIFALGMVMWEMAANCTTPFMDQSDSLVVIILITSGEREELPDDTPADYRRWVELCWEQDPVRRPKASDIALYVDQQENEVGDDAVRITFSDIGSSSIKNNLLDDDGSAVNSVVFETNSDKDFSYGSLVFDFADNGTKDTPLKSIDTLLQLAEDGDIEAQIELADRYEKGDGVPQSAHDAFFQYFQAAAAGNAQAQYRTGELYLYGQGSVQSDVDAAEWYRKAADQGHADAQNNLGLLYLNGQGVAQSDVEAAVWYRKAADQDHASAQISLGWMYYKGIGVERNKKLATDWFQKAARKGDPDAVLILHEMSRATQ